MKVVLLLVIAACSGPSSPDHGGMVNNNGLDGSLGVDAPGDGPDAVLASTPLLTFGTVLVDTASTGQAATIWTTAGASEISNLVVTGPGANAYVIESETCIGSIVEGTSTCAATIHFAPATAGATDATLDVTGTANGVATIVLKGTGATAGALAFTPTSGAFGNVTASSTFDVTLELQDVGATQTGTITVDISGPDATLFAVTANNCAGLAPAGTCNLTVRFSPASTGARSATLTATDAWGGSMTAALTGTGI